MSCEFSIEWQVSTVGMEAYWHLQQKVHNNGNNNTSISIRTAWQCKWHKDARR